MGLLIAGSRSTGTTGTPRLPTRASHSLPPAVTASWLVIFLGCHPEWREKALHEVRALLPPAAHPVPPPHARLACVPLHQWEAATPVLDALLRETLRIAQPHVAMRRNIGPELHIAGRTVPAGDFVVYPFSDVHLDPALYPDPWTFDPTRPEPKREGAFVGWGAGA